MAGLQLSRARRPEVLAGVGVGETVEVDDLGPGGEGDPEDGFAR